ncbi:MAG: chitobiase/beta-hexosaminidase C-terminal domain-containing protein, partial [Myxococcales bacterium]|nr:chitobiase/beta-hexosaminidase C-terminal domain-containing protein [Myxococcales bacterium]
MSIKRAPWIILLLLAAACGDDGGDDGPKPDIEDQGPPRECEENARRCAGDRVIELCRGGQWAELGPCSAEQVCDRGLCTARPCEPDCGSAECGDDGCGGACGTCAANEACVAGQCATLSACGDGACVGTETCATCPADCGACCGDDACDPAANEDCATCPADCACPQGEVCSPLARACVPGCTPDCTDAECGDDGCNGSCGRCAADEVCGADRQCAPVCVPDCRGRVCGDDGCDGVCGVCPEGAVCGPGGACFGGAVCDCDDAEICLDGLCRAPDEICGADNPVGLCPQGRTCLAGACTDVGAGCSVNNPTGVCDVGQICRDGACAALDGRALCDDHNACTDDLYDPVRNACVHVAVNAQCDDGNACSVDRCEAGVCVGDPIAGCVAPPRLDPVTSPTNEADLILSGDKPAGASVHINGAEAVPESPERVWAVEVQLVPGENVFEIHSNDQGNDSAVVVVRVVYDITPPNIIINPPGGVFLDGITVTVTTDEPAVVYFTDDGGTPDQWSESFRSLKTFRVFDDTTLRFIARDDAGNWSEGIVEGGFEITGDGTGWRPAPALPEPIIHGAATEYHGVLFLIGGTDGLEPQAGVWRLEAGADAWIPDAALPSARAQAAAVTRVDQLFVLGGQNDGIPLNTVQRLDVDANAWVNRSPMPTTRFGLAAISHGNYIYAFGGKANGGAVLNTVERYEVGADRWDNGVAQMPRPRYAHQAVLLDDAIYLIGGEDEDGHPIAEVDVYRPANNQWQRIPDLPTPRSFAMAAPVINPGNVGTGLSGIVVAGGRVADGRMTPVVEEYVVGENRWKPRRPLDEPRQAAGVVGVRTPGALDTEDWHVVLIGGVVPGGAVGT